MANKKYKLTDGNYWATDGVYDFDQGKTQREVNSDLSGAINSINAEVTDDSPAAVNGIYFRYRIRHNILYFSIFGTPTSTATVSFSIPRALALGVYISTPQWGNTANIMQVYADPNATAINMRNFTLNQSVNVTGSAPLVIS